MNAYGNLRINNGEPLRAELRVDHEVIDVSTSGGSKPDLKWGHFDAAGHFHAFDADGKLPTLRTVELHDTPNGCSCDEPCGLTETEYRCFGCNEVVEPKYVATPAIHESRQGRATVSMLVYGDIPETGSFVYEGTTAVFFGFYQMTAVTVTGSEGTRTEVLCHPVGRRMKAPKDVVRAIKERVVDMGWLS